EFLHSIKVDVDIGNHIVDYIENIKIDVNPLGVYDFIKENHTKPKLKLEWIPYTRLENFTKIAQSELGTIYRATCSDIRDHSSKFTVAVKCFSKSQDFKKYFLNEKKYEFFMRFHPAIHDADFIHCNLHSGNILYIQGWKIGDLGLSQPANNTLQSNDIYGAIPYIAPEIFNGDPYSKDSDIYSMGMIMWECASNRKPFADIEHDLIVKIINGLRPKVPKDTPEWLAELMRKCWHSDPSKRPSITMIRTTLKNNYKDDSLSEIKRPVSTEFSGKLPKVVTSRTLNSLMSRPSINSSSMNSNKMIQNQDDVTKEDKFDEYFNRLSIIYANSTNQNPSDTSAIYSSKQLIEDFGNLGIKSSDG
ncbi:3043_t:CDS:2, partial [Funneliformis geosporum]